MVYSHLKCQGCLLIKEAASHICYFFSHRIQALQAKQKYPCEV